MPGMGSLISKAHAGNVPVFWEDAPAPYTMKDLNLVLKGDIASNKNSLVARLSNAMITHLRKIPTKVLHDKSKTNETLKALAKFIRVTHNRRYKTWFEEAKKQLGSQIEFETYFPRVHIDFLLYFPRHGISGGDNSNKQQSIEDVLVDLGIIDDDNFECLVSYSVVGKYRKDEGGAEIKIKILNN